MLLILLHHFKMTFIVYTWGKQGSYDHIRFVPVKAVLLFACFSVLQIHSRILSHEEYS